MKKFNIWFRDRMNASSKKNDLLCKLAAGPGPCSQNHSRDISRLQDKWLHILHHGLG
jgi:hypothetical protein